MSSAGQRFGRYELLTRLGRGGMAEVHLARLHGIAGFEKLVAIKLMLPHLTLDRSFVEQFLDEGRIAARIAHPNVCQVFEIGEDKGQLFHVMEYLEGATWDELVPRLAGDPMTLVRVLTGVLAQACEGLRQAHELRVVHRDISPQNLFITVDGVCKVLDFGVAKMEATGTRTRTGVLKGKLPYMSPEQVKGEPLDARSDVFAVGVIMWETLAKRPLFVREAEFHTLKAITEERIDTVSTWEPGYGPEVDAVVMRALARDPAQRHASMRELANELRVLGDRWGGALTSAELGELVRVTFRDALAERAALIAALRGPDPVGPSRPSAKEVETVVDRPAGRSVVLRPQSMPMESSSRRRRWPLAIGAVLAVAAAAIIAVKFTANPSTSPHQTTSTSPSQTTTVTTSTSPSADAAVASADMAAPSADAVVANADPASPGADVAVTSAGLPPTASSTSSAKGQRGRKRHATAQVAPPRPPEPVTLAPGMLSVNAKPLARIYIDGVFVDETPVFEKRVSAGRHEVRIVPVEGKPQTMQITIEPGRVLNLGTVTL